MGVKVGTPCLNWSSSISSPSSKRCCLSDVTLILCHGSSLFGKKLNRSRSCESLKTSKNKQHSIRRIVSSANFDEFALRFHSEDQDSNLSDCHADELELESEGRIPDQFDADRAANWSGNMVILEDIERKANSVELPFSLRIIKKKKQLWEEGLKEAKDCSFSSMKKAFSSMVFIIRELQSYTLQMREVLFLEDLQEVLVRVQKEMNASFVWLFQQVFSHTPTLMVYVMILLANYSVYSMSNNVSFATPIPPSSATVEITAISTLEQQKKENKYFDHSVVKTLSGDLGDGGGGKPRPLINSGTDDGEESISGQVNEVEEWGLWKSIVTEAEKINGGLDHETMQRFVSPVSAKIDPDLETDDYLKTEIVYQTGLSQEPDNPLLLANYAQFLYLIAHDHQRAEVYFKRASEIEPKDPEALSKYASFLWHAKNDLWAAEETFLEAISADPSNSFYTASYAHFLWSSGAEDTCFPLETPENVNYDEF